MSEAPEKKLKMGQELRVRVYDEGGYYLTQVLLSASKVSDKPLSVYYFSDAVQVIDCDGKN